MVNDLALGIFIPVLFWALDTLIKVLGSISTEDVGADLCLFGISFNLTTIIVSLISSPHDVETNDYATVAVITFVVSLIFYVLTLLVIAPGKRKNDPIFIQKLRAKPNRVQITVVVGLLIVIAQTSMYIWFFNS